MHRTHMNARRTSSTTMASAFGRKALLLCALFAMVCKAIIPSGYMLASSNTNDLVAVVLCTGAGSQTMFMGSDGQLVSKAVADAGTEKDQPQKSPASDHPCTFAGHSIVALGEAEAIVEAAWFAKTVVATRLLVHDQMPGRGLAAPPPPATASPILI